MLAFSVILALDALLFDVMKATNTAKGQITLPAKLRRKSVWVPGTVLEFDEDAPLLQARKVVVRRRPRSVIGCLCESMPETVDDYLGETRGAVELPPMRRRR